MLDPKLERKIKVFIREQYFDADQVSYQLTEEAEEGLSLLDVSFSAGSADILCISNYDKKKRCEFLSETSRDGMRKCVDHALLVKQPSGKWIVHLIEMKSSIGNETWINIKQKVRASILNIKALAAVLDLPIDTFLIYTTYKELVFGNKAPENPIERKAALGRADMKKDEWDRERILINLLEDRRSEYHHTGIQMAERSVDGKQTLCGALQIT